MHHKDTFSLRAVVITAGVTFAISAIGSVMVTRWTDRAKPVVTVASVGFSGSDQTIPINEEIRNLAEENPWVDNFKKYEPWTVLSNTVELTHTVQERLTRGISIADDWIKDIGSRFASDQAGQMTFDELGDYPYFVDDIIGLSLTGMARRNELSSAPVSVGDIRLLEPITERHHDQTRQIWLFNMGERTVLVPYSDARTQSQRDNLEEIAISFEYGVGQNLLYYMKRFLEDANRDKVGLTTLDTELRNALHPQTRLYANAIVFNSGKTPMILKPYSLLIVLNDNLNKSDFLLVGAQVGESTADLDRLNEQARAETMEGVDVHTEPFLPSTNERQYLFVPPESSVTIRLETVDPLGKHGQELRSIYDLGILECSVIFSSIDGRPVESSAAVFGKKISVSDRKALEAAQIKR
ncbi:MAG: hypothetical protein OXP69_12785 [Spirochaetaceae bacterium]|nr:hypothetical protein [Spirochaetaceae bacterium]MDE0337848.1 hypothetical protein [Caldilineaceae bacterium]